MKNSVAKLGRLHDADVGFKRLVLVTRNKRVMIARQIMPMIHPMRIGFLLGGIMTNTLLLHSCEGIFHCVQKSWRKELSESKHVV